MSDKFANPNFTMSSENLDIVNRKERESRSLGGGISSSWTSPPDPSLIPADKLELIRKSQEAHPVVKIDDGAPAYSPRLPMSKQRLVTIPSQAMKSFKQILGLMDAVQVNLTSEQSKMLLDALSAMPTPKNMMDAKAIFNLMEMLG